MPTKVKTHITIVKQNFEVLKNKFGVKRIAIFGSTARGENTARSDIDIIVEFNKPIGLFAFVDLENHLSKILGKKVDLTTKKALKPTIKKTVLKEAIYA